MKIMSYQKARAEHQLCNPSLLLGYGGMAERGTDVGVVCPRSATETSRSFRPPTNQPTMTYLIMQTLLGNCLQKF